MRADVDSVSCGAGCPVMLKVPSKGLSGALAGMVLVGCAGTHDPVLYPNAHLQRVGQVAAQQDIAECRQLASSSGVAEHKDAQVARNAGTGAAVGGASAGAWGLVKGNAGESALAGAAAGAAAGTVRSAIQSSETSPVYKNFVQKCLHKRGYEVIGWQ